MRFNAVILDRWRTEMITQHMRALRQGSTRELKAIQAALQKERAFSLVELINSRLPNPVRGFDCKALDAVSEADRVCRETSNQVANGTWVPFSALQVRDLNTTTGAPLVNGKMLDVLEDVLRPASAIVAAGATVISGIQGGNLILPAADAALDASALWIDGEGSYGNAEPSYRQITVTPKTIAVELRFSRMLLRNANIDFEMALRREIVLSFMGQIDKAALIGDSGNHQPDGLLTLAGTPLVEAGTNGGAPTWQHVVDLEHAVAAANGDIKAGAFLMNAAVQRKLRTTQRAAGLDFIMNGEGAGLAGYTSRVSQHVPSNLTKGTSSGICSALLFGDFAQLIVGFWGPAAIDFIVDGVTQAKDGFVRIVARADVGVAPRNIGAFAVMKDVLTS